MGAGGGGLLYLIDVEGELIPQQNVAIDTDASSYDVSNIEYVNGRWSYKSKNLLVNVKGNATSFERSEPCRYTF